MAAELVLSRRRPWLAVVALVVASAGFASAVSADQRTDSTAADAVRTVVLGPVAGEPCGLRIRGNMPC
jgi:hypothetical protein